MMRIILSKAYDEDASGTYEGWEERSASRVLDARKRRAVQRSWKIVEAARDIVREGGLDTLTIQAVLDRTGLSLRAFYERFAGKDELLLAMFEEAVKDAAALHEAESADVVDPIDRLHATVTGLFTRAVEGTAARQSVPLSREHLRLAEARPVELRYAMEPLTQLVETQIRAGMDAGQVRRTDPRRLAVLIVNLVSAHIHAVLLGSAGELDAELSGDDLWTFCWRAIRADES